MDQAACCNVVTTLEIGLLSNQHLFENDMSRLSHDRMKKLLPIQFNRYSVNTTKEFILAILQKNWQVRSP